MFAWLEDEMNIVSFRGFITFIQCFFPKFYHFLESWFSRFCLIFPQEITLDVSPEVQRQILSELEILYKVTNNNGPDEKER